MELLERAREGWRCSGGMPAQAPGPPPQEEAVQGAASPWSVCVDRKHAGAQLFRGGVWVS